MSSSPPLSEWPKHPLANNFPRNNETIITAVNEIILDIFTYNYFIVCYSKNGLSLFIRLAAASLAPWGFISRIWMGLTVQLDINFKQKSL